MPDQPAHPERRDNLVREVAALRAEVLGARRELTAHVEEEMPALRIMLQELGDPKEVRIRRIFVEAWIERERNRAALRKAIIEKGLLMALVALVTFIVVAVGHEVRDIVRASIGHPK